VYNKAFNHIRAERAHARMSRRENFSRRRKRRQQTNILWYSVIINL